jgi:hypothetical protein
MAVHFCHDGGNGTTPSDGHSEVMDRVDIRRLPDTLDFLENAAYPSLQPERPTWRKTRGCGHHQQAPRKFCMTF